MGKPIERTIPSELLYIISKADSVTNMNSYQHFGIYICYAVFLCDFQKTIQKKEVILWQQTPARNNDDAAHRGLPSSTLSGYTGGTLTPK